MGSPNAALDLVVVGCGQIGSAVARRAAHSSTVRSLRLVDHRLDKAETVASALVGAGVAESIAAATAGAAGNSVVVIAAQRDQVELAAEALDAGAHVITLVERPETAEKLFGLGDRDRCVVVGAGLLPGVADVLTALAAQRLDQVSEVHLSRWGWAGARSANESRRARLHEMRSGRELVWFPDPVGGRDCYLAEHAAALTVGRLLPGVQVHVRLGVANKIDWLRRRRPETVGLQVEVRGWREGSFEVEVLGVAERADVACAVVLLSAAELVAGSGSRGAIGLAELAPAEHFVHAWTNAGLTVHEFSPTT